MATVRGKAEGKSAFLKEYFVDHPDAGEAAINAAWRDAGHEGRISSSLISQIRKQLGLRGKGQPTTKSKSSGGGGSKKREMPARGSDARGADARGHASVANGRQVEAASGRHSERRSGGDERTRVFVRLETQIDEMLHEVRMAGGLPEFEETLRKARRVLVRSHEE